MADDKKQTPPPAPSRDVEKQDRPGRLDETVRRPPSRPFNDTNTVSDTLKPPPPPDKK
jgi:hypothetical protein